MYEKALIVSKGGDRNLTNVMVNAHSHNIYSGTCSNPLTIPHGWFVPGLGHKNYSLINYSKPVVGLDFNKVRCRTCPNCIKAAQYHWQLRAVDEFEASKYSAFGTLTFSEHFFSRKWREENSRDVGSTWIDAPAFDERGRQQELELLLRELTLCLKRMRKAGWSLRYMAVTEFGTKGGRPHIHFVMHLPEGSAPYSEFRKALKANWEHFPGCKCAKNDKGNYVENCRVGWADVRPVKSNHAAAYACKYIGKQRDTVAYDGQVLATSERCRVRASIRYGHRVSLSNPVGIGTHSVGLPPVLQEDMISIRHPSFLNRRSEARTISPAGLGREGLTSGTDLSRIVTREGANMRAPERGGEIPWLEFPILFHPRC